MRTIAEIHLLDVSIVTYPTNPAAVAQLRGEERSGMSLELAEAILATV